MPEVHMYSTANCPYCVAAERLLTARGVRNIEKRRIDIDPALHAEMMNKTQRRTVPQIYIGDVHVGGYTDLVALDREGQLRELLEADSSPPMS